MSRPTTRVYTQEEHNRLVGLIAVRMHDDGFKPDVIVAIMRGGGPAGLLLSYALNVPLATIAVKTNGERKKGRDHPTIRVGMDMACIGVKWQRVRRVLLVDDMVDSGFTLRTVTELGIRSLIPSTQTPPKNDPCVRTAVVWAKHGATFIPDYVGEHVALDCNGNAPWIVQPFESAGEAIAYNLKRVISSPSV